MSKELITQADRDLFKDINIFSVKEFIHKYDNAIYDVIKRLLNLEPNRIFIPQYAGGIFDSTTMGINAFVPSKEKILMPEDPKGPPSIMHEIGHWLDMKDPKRWIIKEWGFDDWSPIPFEETTVSITNKKAIHNKAWSYNQYKADRSKKSQARFTKYLSTELRVRSIEYRLNSSSFQTNKFINKIIGSFNWGDMSLIMLPFAKFQTVDHLKDWIGTLGQTTYNHWTEDKIEFEFKKRLDYWGEWAETK